MTLRPNSTTCMTLGRCSAKIHRPAEGPCLVTVKRSEAYSYVGLRGPKMAIRKVERLRRFRTMDNLSDQLFGVDVITYNSEAFNELDRQKAREAEQQMLRAEARTRLVNALVMALAVIALGVMLWLATEPRSESSIDAGYENSETLLVEEGR